MATEVRKRALGTSVIHQQVRIDSDELIAAATTQTIDVTTLPTGAVLIAAWIDNVEAATDAGSISALTLEVGTAGDPDALVDGFDLFGATGRMRLDGVGVETGGLAVKAKFTSTGADLGTGAATGLDTGIVDIHLLYVVVP